MDKAQKKQRLKQLREAQRAAFWASLPMPAEDFAALFDHLDAQEQDCAGDLRETIAFLQQNHCPVEPVVEWLRQHGAGCDCEVLLNVEEQFEG